MKIKATKRVNNTSNKQIIEYVPTVEFNDDLFTKCWYEGFDWVTLDDARKYASHIMLSLETTKTVMMLFKRAFDEECIRRNVWNIWEDK